MRNKVTLGSVVALAVDGKLPNGMLFMHAGAALHSDAECAFAVHAAEGMVATGIEKNELANAVIWARTQKDPPPAKLVLDALAYWLAHDAFPGDGAGRADRDFYDQLGPEDPTRACKREGCTQGAVAFSVLCRTHHFESVWNYPCPYDD